MDAKLIVFTLVSVEHSGAGRIIDHWTTAADRQYALQHRRHDGQRHTLLGRAALRALLSVSAGRRNCIFRIDSRGKLFVEPAQNEPDLDVSLTHSRGIVACAVSTEGPIGIDVETHRRRAYAAIAEHAFGPNERALVNKGGEGAFYRIWTVREAMGKATGEGLSFVTDGIDRVQQDPHEGCWTFCHQGRRWLLAHRCPHEGVSLSIAVLAQSGLEWSLDSISSIEIADLTY